jgi:hypothetical protein
VVHKMYIAPLHYIFLVKAFTTLYSSHPMRTMWWYMNHLFDLPYLWHDHSPESSCRTLSGFKIAETQCKPSDHTNVFIIYTSTSDGEFCQGQRNWVQNTWFAKPIDMTIHWKALQFTFRGTISFKIPECKENYLMVPLLHISTSSSSSRCCPLKT